MYQANLRNFLQVIRCVCIAFVFQLLFIQIAWLCKACIHAPSDAKGPGIDRTQHKGNEHV